MKNQLLLVIVVLACLLSPQAYAAGPAVSLMRVPEGGVQPQAVVDQSGKTHLIYYKGDPKHGDIFYVTWLPGRQSFLGSPMQVNKLAGGACAIGTIRGAQLAVDGEGRAHVVWNASSAAGKASNGHIPLFYTRLNDKGTEFEPERDLIAGTEMLDGGSSLATDGRAGVYVVWHASEKGSDEAHGGVYLRSSRDGGVKFDQERRVDPAHGACGCCSMRAFVDRSGVLYILYRTAINNSERDAELLTSNDHGKSFQSRTLSRLMSNTCPMSTFTMIEGSEGVSAGWENNGQVLLSSLHGGGKQEIIPLSPPGSGQRKYPVLAVSPNGETLFSWTEGAGWGHGGASSWQLFDAHGKPLAEHGQVTGVPVWSFTAAVPNGARGFTIIY